MDTNLSKSIVKIQSFYEKNLKVSERKDLGVFLTNNIETVDEILDLINFDDANILTKKFLEPSCGNGVFIIRLLERIFNESISSSQFANFIESNICFVDINEEMIETTKQNIKEFYKIRFEEEYTGDFNSFVFDFTQRIRSKHNNTLFNSDVDIPLSQFLNEIDYVIGNPPYVSLYGRRDRKTDENQRIYYLNKYSQFPKSLKNGKINFVMLFIEHSIDFLKDGGKLSFIIDVSFFETAYEHTRKYLLDNTQILSIKYNIQDFDVASGQIILTIQKKKIKENIVSIINHQNKSVTYVNQKLWYKSNDQYKFRFNMCSKSSKIVDKIFSKKNPTLKTLYPKKNLRTCVMLLNMEDKFVFDKPLTNMEVDIYPYYKGSKGLKEKFSKLNHTKYFHYNHLLQDKINDELKIELIAKGIKNKKRLGLGEKVIYNNPKVFIRQSAKEIIASYDENPSSANNSLYVFSLRNNSNSSIQFLKFLCGLLNSDLITFFAQQRTIIRFSKGKQPQIKISDLYTLPVPIDSEIQKRIADLVDLIYKNESNSEYIKEINYLIYNHFNISKNEIHQIKKSIESF